jgi:hypothetical protein
MAGRRALILRRNREDGREAWRRSSSSQIGSSNNLLSSFTNSSQIFRVVFIRRGAYIEILWRIDDAPIIDRLLGRGISHAVASLIACVFRGVSRCFADCCLSVPKFGASIACRAECIDPALEVHFAIDSAYGWRVPL